MAEYTYKNNATTAEQLTRKPYMLNISYNGCIGFNIVVRIDQYKENTAYSNTMYVTSNNKNECPFH